MTDVPTIDVLIVGGGINGCGTFRDLAAQGINCLLLERGDFCSGASAASSRLMHGGLKYLETGEFGLVRESLTERNRLLSNAAHYVSPLPTILPLRSRFRGILPSVARFLGLKAKLTDRGSVITRLGLTLYDIFGRNYRTMPNHRILGRAALDARVPGMERGVIAAGLYYEGQLSHAERLGLELLLDGEALNPRSSALNYARVTKVEDGVVTYRHDGTERRVRPRVIINAGGAWIDAVNRDLGLETQLMGGSKGSHLILDNPAFHRALNGHMIYFGTADGRVNLCYPVMDKVLVGSTDIPVGDPDEALCDPDEVSYLVDAVSGIFPDIPLSEDQVRYRFCGVRPLPRADGEIGMVTRDHSIATLDLGNGTPVLCLIGGKWTTFRAFSEQTADRVLTLLERHRFASTSGMAIGGGAGFPAESAARATWIDRLSGETGLGSNRVAALLERYGTKAGEIAQHCKNERALRSLPQYSVEELSYLCRHERVRRLSDLLLRRTFIAMSGALTAESIDECARIAAAALGWTDAHRRQEAEALRPLVETGARTGVTGTTSAA